MLSSQPGETDPTSINAVQAGHTITGLDSLRRTDEPVRCGIFASAREARKRTDPLRILTGESVCTVAKTAALSRGLMAVRLPHFCLDTHVFMKNDGSKPKEEFEVPEEAGVGSIVINVSGDVVGVFASLSEFERGNPIVLVSGTGAPEIAQKIAKERDLPTTNMPHIAWEVHEILADTPENRNLALGGEMF